MAFVPPKDRVMEYSTSNSQTVFLVTGAVDASYNAFSASMSIGDTTIGGVIEPGVAFKSGILTYSAAGQVTVTTTEESKGTFSASGIKQVFMGLPASLLVADMVGFTPSGPLSSITTQDAIVELATKSLLLANAADVATTGAPSDLATVLTTWTPVLTFATPGDLAVGYAIQGGHYAKLSSNLVLVQFSIVTNAFAWTTASGNLNISGLPFVAQNTGGLAARGMMNFAGINKAGYSQVGVSMAANTSVFLFNASGMGQATAPVVAADVPTGGTVVVNGEIIIFI